MLCVCCGYEIVITDIFLLIPYRQKVVCNLVLFYLRNEPYFISLSKFCKWLINSIKKNIAIDYDLHFKLGMQKT